MEVSHRVPIVVPGRDEVHRPILLKHQVIADIVGPVREPEAGIKDVLPPAPLVKAGAHRDRGACRISIDLCAHVVVLEGLQRRVQLIQCGRNLQSQLIQPLLIDHGELRDRVDTVVLVIPDGSSSHLLCSRKPIDTAILHRDRRPDLRVLLQDCGEVGHVLLGQVGAQVDKGPVRAVGHQVIVGEANSLEGIREISAGDAHVDLLLDRIAHRLPLNADPRVLFHGRQDGVVIVARGQGALCGKHLEVGLGGVLVCLRRASRLLRGILSPGRTAASHQCRPRKEGRHQRCNCSLFHTFPF